MLQLMTYNLFGWEFNMDSVAFTIPGTSWGVYWYGILITFGFVLAVVYALKRAKKFGVNPDKLMDCILVTAPLSIIGARAYYIIFDDSITFENFFKIHNGGMAILGAVITAAVVGALMCIIRKINILSTLDLAALGFLIGQSIGRWGNFVNQEAYGSVTGSSWFGISGDRIIDDMGTTMPVHPCFLYESLWCAIGFIILHFVSKKRKFTGQIACMYLMWYGLGRFIIEYFRTDSLMLGDVKVSMLLSGLMVIGGGVLLMIGFKKSDSKSLKPSEYVPVFDEVIEKEEVADNTNTVVDQIDNVDSAVENNDESVSENTEETVEENLDGTNN